jgi:hypothetical protein
MLAAATVLMLGSLAWRCRWRAGDGRIRLATVPLPARRAGLSDRLSGMASGPRSETVARAAGRQTSDLRTGAARRHPGDGAGRHAGLLIALLVLPAMFLGRWLYST